MIQVIVADDHDIVRGGIRGLLDKTDIQMIGEADNGETAVKLAAELEPDVTVLDITMPGLNGLQAIKKIQEQGGLTQIIILSMHCDLILIQQALKSGAKGYLLKKAVSEDLPLAIEAVHKGTLYLSSAMPDHILEDLFPLPNEDWIIYPTPREKEVLILIGAGYTNQTTADTLGVSIKTVEKHRGSLMRKLRVSDFPSLIKRAIILGLISIDN